MNVLFLYRLKIRRAVPNDTGNYTCVSTIAQAASIYAHVISGKWTSKYKKKRTKNIMSFVSVEFTYISGFIRSDLCDMELRKERCSAYQVSGHIIWFRIFICSRCLKNIEVEWQKPIYILFYFLPFYSFHSNINYDKWKKNFVLFRTTINQSKLNF